MNSGLIVTTSAIATVHRKLIITLAARHKLPAVYSRRLFVTDGGLISYGSRPDRSVSDLRQATSIASSRAKSPPTCRCRQPTKYELVINLKTAKALGLDVAADAARPRRRGDRMSAPGKAGAIQPVEVRPK